MPDATARILLAEDNPADVFLVKEAMEAHNLTVYLHVVHDGEAAIRYIEAAEQGHDAAPCPELALLDLNLPRINGLAVLARLRRSPKCGNIPVAIISSCRAPGEYGAVLGVAPDHFFTKPSTYEEFLVLGGIVKNLLKRIPGLRASGSV